MSARAKLIPPNIVIDKTLPVKDRDKLTALIASRLPASRIHDVKIFRISDRVNAHHQERFEKVVTAVEGQGGPKIDREDYLNGAPAHVAELRVSQLLRNKETPIDFDTQDLAEKICLETGWHVRGGPLTYTGYFAARVFSVLEPYANRFENILFKIDSMFRINAYSSRVSVEPNIRLAQADAEKVFDWFLTSGRIFKVSVTHRVNVVSAVIDRLRSKQTFNQETNEVLKAIDQLYTVNFVQILRFGQPAVKYGHDVFAIRLFDALPKEQQKYFLVADKEKITTVLGAFLRRLGIAAFLVGFLWLLFVKNDYFDLSAYQSVSHDAQDLGR